MQRATLAALILAATTGIPAAAQNIAGAAQVAPLPEGESSVLTTTVSQSFNADSNYQLDDTSAGTSYYGDTRIGFDLLQQTETKTFALGINTGIRPLWEAGRDFTIVAASPSRAYITYDQEGPDTTFDSDFRVRTREVDSSTTILEVDPDTGQADILNDLQNSREVRYDANIGFAIGTNSPSTYEFRVLGSAFNYADTDNDTNLVPKQTAEAQALWTLAFTPVFSTAVFGSYSYFTSDDDVSTVTKIAEAEAGLVYTPSDVFRLRGGIGYADRQKTQDLNPNTDQRGTETNTGPTIRGDVRYITPDFTVFGNARLTTAAPQTRLSGQLNAVYQLPRGQLNGRIFQNYTGGQGGEDLRINGVGIGLTRDINTVSRVGLDFSYATQVTVDEGNSPDIDRTDVTASYSYDLTEAVSAQIGYTFRNRIESGTAQSNQVFLVLGKTFETGL